MGMGGHILGPKKLRKLNANTGLGADRAYRRGGYCEARVRVPGGCEHYEVDWVSWEARLVEAPFHWASCQEVLNGN